jgi:hypothetical protein
MACVLADTGVIPLPSSHRQVNEDWLGRYRGWVYGSGFGLQLGAGVATIVTSATVYLTLVAEFLVGSALVGALIGATFGIARAAPLAVRGRARSHQQLIISHSRLLALAPAGRRMALALTAGAAVVLVSLSMWSRG